MWHEGEGGGRRWGWGTAPAAAAGCRPRWLEHPALRQGLATALAPAIHAPHLQQVTSSAPQAPLRPRAQRLQGAAV